MKMAYQSCFGGIKEEQTEEQTNQVDITPIHSTLNHTIFHQSYSASQSPASSTKARRKNYSNEGQDTRSRRLAKNAQRMRDKRSNESFDDYKFRLAKNAEANRRKRQNENEIERAMRQVKDAARQRLRRAMETPDQRSIRLSKLAERMRLVRANESPEQRSDRLVKSATRARERLMSETNEERRERLRKRAEYARRMRALNSSATSDTSSTKSHENKRKLSPIKNNGNHSKNLNYTNSHLTSHNPNAQVSSSNNNNNNNTQDEAKYTPIGKYSSHHLPQLGTFQPPIPNGQHDAAHNPYISGRPDINEKHEYPQQQQVTDMRTQFSAFHQNSFFRPNNFLNIPNYTNPMRLPPPDNLLYNNFGAPVQSQVQNHIPHFMPSLPLPPHPYQTAATSMLSHHIPLPSNTDHLQHHLPTDHYHPLHPFHQSNHQHPPLINDVQAHAAFNRQMGINGGDENKPGDRQLESYKMARNRFRKTTSTDDECSRSTSPELKVDVDRHKKMNELLEEQINIMLASPKRTRGRPSKGRETPTEREERLRKMAESRRLKRQNESPAERQMRLQMLTKRARERRELIRNSETDGERKERLAKQAEYARRRRMKEQTPEAKEKAEQRARELYAKLHGNGNHSQPQSPIHDHDGEIDDDEERVKIRIPHPYKQLTGLMIKSMHSEAYGDDNNDVLKMLEPIIEMKTV